MPQSYSQLSVHAAFSFCLPRHTYLGTFKI